MVNPLTHNKGRFTPKHPEKYNGDVSNIIFRSSWERDFCIFCDNNVEILQWASEEIFIPYFDPVQKKRRNYFPDFWIRKRNKDGSIVKEIIEIKPSKQTQRPRLVGKNKRTQLLESQTYVTNVAKWSAAQNFCSKYGITFRIITEKELYGKGTKTGVNRNKRNSHRNRTSVRRSSGPRRRNNTRSRR